MSIFCVTLNKDSFCERKAYKQHQGIFGMENIPAYKVDTHQVSNKC